MSIRTGIETMECIDGNEDFTFYVTSGTAVQAAQQLLQEHSDSLEKLIALRNLTNSAQQVEMRECSFYGDVEVTYDPDGTGRIRYEWTCPVCRYTHVYFTSVEV